MRPGYTFDLRLHRLSTTTHSDDLSLRQDVFQRRVRLDVTEVGLVVLSIADESVVACFDVQNIYIYILKLFSISNPLRRVAKLTLMDPVDPVTMR